MKNKLYIIFFLLILLVFSCKRENKTVMITDNKKLAELFKQKEYVSNLVKRFFLKSFYKIELIKFNKYTDLIKEFDLVTKKNKKGVFFLDNLEFNTLISDRNRFTDNRYKIATYNYESVEIKDFDLQPVINFTLNSTLLSNQIESSMKWFSKNRDLSDCAVVISKTHKICKSIQSELQSKYSNISFYDSSTSISSINKWISENSNKYRVFVLFGFDINVLVKDLDESLYKDNRFIEVLSNYGDIYDVIDTSIGINWDNLVEHGLHSKEFKDFLSDKYNNKSILNLALDFKNIVSTNYRFNIKKTWIAKISIKIIEIFKSITNNTKKESENQQ